MLILTRRPGESIVIQGNIIVTVTQIKGDRARIGIQAPAEVPVDRLEVHESKQLGPARGTTPAKD